MTTICGTETVQKKFEHEDIIVIQSSAISLNYKLYLDFK